MSSKRSAVQLYLKQRCLYHVFSQNNNRSLLARATLTRSAEHLCTVALEVTLHRQFSISFSEVASTQQLLGAHKHEQLCCIALIMSMHVTLAGRRQWMFWLKQTWCYCHYFKTNWTAASSWHLNDTTVESTKWWAVNKWNIPFMENTPFPTSCECLITCL